MRLYKLISLSILNFKVIIYRQCEREINAKNYAKTTFKVLTTYLERLVNIPTRKSNVFVIVACTSSTIPCQMRKKTTCF